MTVAVALDSSVAIPLVVARHTAHRVVTAWWRRLPSPDVALAGQALAETYSVLTRLPGDLRLLPQDAARLLSTRLAQPLTLSSDTQQRLPEVLQGLGIAGGAAYDGLVGLAAAEHGVPLATRDLRARNTYERVGVQVLLVA